MSAERTARILREMAADVQERDRTLRSIRKIPDAGEQEVDMPEQAWQVRARLLDRWATTWRTAIEMGLDPEPIAQNADEATIRRQGSALFKLVKQARASAEKGE